MGSSPIMSPGSIRKDPKNDRELDYKVSLIAPTELKFEFNRKTFD